MRKKSKLVYGVGVNDADYEIRYKQDGVVVLCPFYAKWEGMLKRCYCVKYHVKKPTYIDCSVCSEWLNFSNFKAWMEKQDWQGKQLDKDLIFRNNKVYSPDTCVFVDATANAFTTDCKASRGAWPIGVYFDAQSNRFMASCSNPFKKKLERLGSFSCPTEAHQAWKKRKHELACQLAELQTDSRVAAALRTRYL